VPIALRCDEFEEWVSPYLEGELDQSSARSFEQHRQVCPACNELLSGVREVRGALRGLAGVAAPPDFDLRLPSSLRREIWQRRHAWAEPLTVALAAVAALLIVLWPQAQQEEAGAEPGGVRDLQHLARAWAPVPQPQLAPPWRSRTGRPTAAPYSHALARTVSY